MHATRGPATRAVGRAYRPAGRGCARGAAQSEEPGDLAVRVGCYNQVGGRLVETIRRIKVRIDELADVMQRLNREAMPPETLERRRGLLAEARTVRDAMQPLDEDIKGII